jgi:acetylornithine deacetylase
MMHDHTAVLAASRDLLGSTTDFLDALVRFGSISGDEGPCMHWLADRFADVADVGETVPVPEDIVDDPDYSFRLGDSPYSDRPNVRTMMRGDGSGRSVILNAHADVVPPSPGQVRPFDPRIEDGVMYGRGTSDDKGQIAVVMHLFNLMNAFGVRPRGDVTAHLVIEEETGGNGTLAFVRDGCAADCCLNLEPAENKVLAAIRGAVWFRCEIEGRAGHSGAAGTTVSALEMAIKAMQIIESYHDEVLAATHGDIPLFLAHKNPMPVTFGRLDAGTWPAMAPPEAVLEGVFGLLTTPKEEVMREIESRVRAGDPWLADHVTFTFPYRHDTSTVSPDHELVTTLLDSYDDAGMTTSVGSAPYSSDAWFYSSMLGIPTVVTGCGSITDGHTAGESVILDDITHEAAVLFRFIERWSGFRPA